MSSRSESEDNIHERYADLFHDAHDDHDEIADPDYEAEQDEFHGTLHPAANLSYIRWPPTDTLR